MFPRRPAPLATGAALLALAWGAPQAARAQQAPEAFEEGLFELFVQRIPERLPLLTLVDSTGAVWIPLAPVLDHVGIPYVERGDSVVLEWPPDVWESVVSRTARTLRIGPDTTNALDAQLVEWSGETYVSAETLGRILDARVEVVWADLVVVVSESFELPTILRLEQEARRARERFESSMLDTDAFAGVPYEPRTGGVAGGWGLSLFDGQGYSRASLRAALGASVLGGGAEVGATAFTERGGLSESARVDEVFARYTRVFPEVSWLRRVELGSVLSEGTVARRLTGFMLTNHPYTTPRHFGEAVVTPAVPAGWEYEVYQGEHLVGVSTADQPSEIRAPLNYGNTPVRVRMIGPAGQERVEELVYVVPPERVPAREWRYALGGGVCEDPGCDSYAFAEVARGATSWLTLGLGADRLELDHQADVRPYASLGVSPVPNLSAELRLRASSFFRTSLQYFTGARGALSATYTWTEPEGATLAGWTGQASVSGSLPLLGGRWMSARVLLRGLEHGQVDSWQGAVSTILRRTHLALEGESGLQGGTVVTGRVFQALAHPLGPARDVSLEGALGFGAMGVELGEAAVTGRLRDALVEARVRLRRERDPTFTLAVSLRSPFGFFQARGTGGTGRGVFLGADGGLAYDPAVGLVPLTYQSVGRAGVRGVVYRDSDGDGTRDPGEPPVAGADVLVGGQRATTDEEGRFHAWGATPYEGLAVALDSLSIDPEWAPSEPEVLLRPSPNAFAEVSIGVHRTRELWGSVVAGGPDGRPVPGARIEVLDRDGAVVATERTFSDGVFYVPRLRPGAYTVRLAVTPSRRGAPAAPPEVRVEVPPSGDGVDQGDVVAPPLVIPGR
ncbi:MAG TPA: carboxypeptidase-like regulatory domain-containing protein [Longimicrobiales bacterium]|nr:carboxypeptidase-like regulatory domain-containing protein [Longimicrobiales bacterium]